MVVIFGAGGTAGHVFMAMGIAYHLEDKKILITDKRGTKYLCSCGECDGTSCNVFDEVHVLPIDSAKSCFSFKIFDALACCNKVFSQNPDAIYFGCGAYVSLIPGLIAMLKRKDIHIYQGDQIVGTANKFLHNFAKVSWVSSDSLQLKNKRTVGCIVRHYMTRTPMINDGHFNILILGSSIGSFLLGDVIIESLQLLDPSLLDKIRIVQQNNDPVCLGQKYADLGVRARIEKFVDTREEFAKAHLIIGRAGWSLLSDIVATGRAAIVIPWTKAKDNHQYHNALWMSEDKLWIMEEHEVTSERVAKVITDLAHDMLEQNFGAETIQNGIIADRVREITSKFSADGGRTIAHFLNRNK